MYGLIDPEYSKTVQYSSEAETDTFQKVFDGSISNSYAELVRCTSTYVMAANGREKLFIMVGNGQFFFLL